MGMDKMRDKVIEFLREYLEIDEFTLEDCNFVPGGVFCERHRRQMYAGFLRLYER